MEAAEAASAEAAAQAEAENERVEAEQHYLRGEMLENFFEALGKKRNREILNFLLENGPKRYSAVMKFCMVSKEFHTPSNDELKYALQLMDRGGLITINEERELHSTVFSEMALAAIGVAVSKLELMTSN